MWPLDMLVFIYWYFQAFAPKNTHGFGFELRRADPTQLKKDPKIQLNPTQEIHEDPRI
jgi:hypothetical protein